MTVVANKPFPKLGLPAQRQPSAVQATPKVASEIPQDQPYASTIYDLIAQELERVGAKASNASLLEAVMVRIVSDDALFHRLAIQAVRKQCLRRIKKIRRKMLDKEVTVYIAGPDGMSLAFATEEEAEAYRKAQREAEPPLLRCLRKHRNAVLALQQQAQRALAQRRGRSAALADVESQLRGLNSRMFEDIQAAASEAAKEVKP